MTPTEDIAYAIKINPHGSALMCAAAGIVPPEYEDREWAELDIQDQCRSLTGRPLDEVIAQDDIVSRRPFRCAVCGDTFTTDEFRRLRRLSRENGLPRPFDSGETFHEGCSTG